jgi:hypothetical protein
MSQLKRKPKPSRRKRVEAVYRSRHGRLTTLGGTEQAVSILMTILGRKQ